MAEFEALQEKCMKCNGVCVAGYNFCLNCLDPENKTSQIGKCPKCSNMSIELLLIMVAILLANIATLVVLLIK